VTESEVSVEARIAASPAALYDLVSDVTRMGQWSPENTGGRWLRGATGPVVGARFKGANRDGWRRWSTTCTVVTALPGRHFAFDVDFAKVPVARWSYEFAEDGDGCVVTERWADRRARWFSRVSRPVMGVKDRAAHNRDGMRATLDALEVAAEAPVARRADG
jgi:uncharacterized protein YndB with AHSA1/START domain